MNTPRRLLAVSLALAATCCVAPGFSDAAFVSTTRSTASVTAANDWTPPTVTLADPGAQVSGTVTLVASAADDRSAVAEVSIDQRTPAGTWTTLCTTTAAPYSCAWDTTAVADGAYELRARAIDTAGYPAVSSTRTTTVSNAATITLTDPGPLLRGTVTLAANAGSPNGVASVRIQRSPAGTGTWTGVCADSTAPYSCAWDTTAVADGLYDLRAVVTDGKGATLASAVVAGVRVGNVVLRGVDVQTVNGGTAGRIDAGDQVVLTYNTVVAPGSVVAGWDGTSRAVTARAQDGQLLGLTGTDDTLSVDGVALGSVNLGEDYLRNKKNLTFASTMTATTQTVNGVSRTVVTIILGAASAPGVATVTDAGELVWTPSAGARDLYGTACATTPATESGVSDRDF